MIRRVSLITQGLVTLGLVVAGGCCAIFGQDIVPQDALIIVPIVPEPGKPFTVAWPRALAEAGAGISPRELKYKWDVIATVNDAAVIGNLGIDTLTNGVAQTTTPVLTVPVALPNSKYQFKVTKVPEDVDGRIAAAVITFNSTFGQPQELARQSSNGSPNADQPPAGAAPGGSPQGAAPSIAATPSSPPSDAAVNSVAWPAPPLLRTGATVQDVQARIREALAWWRSNAIKDLSPTTVSKDFIVARLSESRDRKFSLKQEIDVPLVAAARFYRAAFDAAPQLNTDDARTIAAWKTERDKALAQLEEDDQESTRALRLVREFLDDVEAEIKSKLPNKFGLGIREAAMLTGNLLLELEEAALADRGSAPGPRGSSGDRVTPSSSGGGYAYGASHAAVRHARVMSRIHMKNERRMMRIQSFP